MNQRLVRVVLSIAVILLPFAFDGASPSGRVATAAVLLPYIGQSASVSPAPMRPALSPQAISMPGGITGWRVQLPDKRPLGTPAIGNGRVLIGGGFGSYEVYAFNATSGGLAWIAKTDDDGPTSPVIENGVGVYNTESCSVEAVDVGTGKKLWSHVLGDPLMSQPAIANGHVYMVSPAQSGRGDFLYCLSLTSGDTIWTQPLPADAISAPVVHGGSIYCATIDGSLTRVDCANGILSWRQAKNATSAPWIDENGVVSVSQRVMTVNGHPVPIGARTGKQRVGTQEAFATTTEDGKYQSNDVAPVSAPYLNANHNNAVMNGDKAADASVGFATEPDGSGLGYANSNLGVDSVDGVWAYQGSRPIVTHGRNYNVQNNVAKCIDERSGRTIWKQTFNVDRTHVRTLTPLSEAGGKLYFGTSTGMVGCLRKSDGARLWTCRLGSPIVFAPSVAKGRVYVTTEDGCLYCLNTHDRSADGWPMWGGTHRTMGRIRPTRSLGLAALPQWEGNKTDGCPNIAHI